MYRVSLNEQSQIVLDFTSLALMYQIWMFHGHEFQRKFIVSRYLVELFSNELSSLQYHADAFTSSNVDLGKVAIDNDHFGFLNDKKKYLSGLLEWIGRYCEVTLSENTIDMIKKAGIHMGENHVIDAALSTLLLVTDDSNRLLVSDDSFSLKMQLLPLDRMMSTEHYLKQTNEPSSPIFDELVHNRYIRYSPTAKQLDEAYLEKLSGQYSNYDLLLENLSLINDRANIETAFAHLKDIALKPLLSREQMIKDLTTPMVNLFKDCTETLIDLFATKLYMQFDILGTRQDDAMLAYNDAKIIVLENRTPN
ncbi:MAG: hypothetical protein EOO93_08085 [Pedobacter sp.]|nr:MAG: hypothetical protein EOO93_08085 [Pedobacter sp.]